MAPVAAAVTLDVVIHVVVDVVSVGFADADGVVVTAFTVFTFAIGNSIGFANPYVDCVQVTDTVAVGVAG